MGETPVSGQAECGLRFQWRCWINRSREQISNVFHEDNASEQTLIIKNLPFIFLLTLPFFDSLDSLFTRCHSHPQLGRLSVRSIKGVLVDDQDQGRQSKSGFKSQQTPRRHSWQSWCQPENHKARCYPSVPPNVRVNHGLRWSENPPGPRRLPDTLRVCPATTAYHDLLRSIESLSFFALSLPRWPIRLRCELRSSSPREASWEN